MNVSRLACAELARRNEVSDRVIIGREFTPANFADYRGKNVLVMVDAEGAEDELLDPNLAPDLGQHVSYRRDAPIVPQQHHRKVTEAVLGYSRR